MSRDAGQTEAAPPARARRRTHRWRQNRLRGGRSALLFTTTWTPGRESNRGDRRRRRRGRGDRRRREGAWTAQRNVRVKRGWARQRRETVMRTRRRGSDCGLAEALTGQSQRATKEAQFTKRSERHYLCSAVAGPMSHCRGSLRERERERERESVSLKLRH